MDKEGSSTGANNLDFTVAPDEGAEAEEVDQEARNSMKNLAKEVSNTTITSDSDTLGEHRQPLKGAEVRDVRVVNELVAVAETFTRSVTSFSNAYHNDEAKIDRAKTSAKTLTDMKAVYNASITCYQDKGTADKFFTGKNHLVHLKIFKKLKENQFK